jgi:hypothetical protein
MQLNQTDMAALLSLLQRMTTELDALKKDLTTVKANAHAVNKEIVRARHGDAVVNTAGDSAVVMQQLASAPMTANAGDQWAGYSLNHADDADLKGYVPGAH